MAETVAAETFIWTKLNVAPALLAGQVYTDEAPQGVAGQYVIISYQGGFDDLTEIGGVRIWANLLYLVKVVGPGRSYTALQAAADGIDTRLHHSSGPVGSTAYVDSCIREQAFRMPETTPSGLPFRHLGGIYRLKVRAV